MPRAQAAAKKQSEAYPPMDVSGGVDTNEEEEEEEPCEQCRVCTIRSDCFSYYNIHEKLIFKNVGVAEALTMVTSMQIRPDDDLPQVICCQCEQRLLDAYHFRKLAESSARGFNRVRASSKRLSTGSITPAAVTVSPVAAPAAVSAAEAVFPKRSPISPAIANNTVAVRQPPRRQHVAAVTVKPKPTAIVREPKKHAQQQLLQMTARNRNNTDKDASDEVDNSMQLEMGADKNTFKIVYFDEMELQRMVPVMPLQRSPRVSSREAVAQLKILNKLAEPELYSSIDIGELEHGEGVEEEEVQLYEEGQDYEVDDEDDGVSFLTRSVGSSPEMTPEETPDETLDETPDETPPTPETLKRPVSSNPSRPVPTKPKTTDANSHGADKTASTNVADQSKRPVNNVRTPETHSDEYMRRKHKCEVCGKRFIGRSNLVDHLRHHANVKLFKCDQCDKSFVQSGSLACHMRTHTLERPFGCDVCGKTFTQASSRQIHVRQHTQERGYVCPVCEKAFYSNSDLSKHKRTHDQVKAHNCPYCTIGFAQKPNMKKHVLKKHPGEPWPVPAS